MTININIYVYKIPIEIRHIKFNDRRSSLKEASITIDDAIFF